MGSRPTLDEDAIIMELKDEKMKFEQNMQQIIEGRVTGNEQDNVAKVVPNDELIRFNAELQAAFKDILDIVDQSQVQAVSSLNHKQADMFQLATKHKLPSGFKNEAIGVWYDAKSSITQNISKLKVFIQEKGVSLFAQSTKPILLDDSRTDAKREEFSTLIQKFENDMA